MVISVYLFVRMVRSGIFMVISVLMFVSLVFFGILLLGSVYLFVRMEVFIRMEIVFVSLDLSILMISVF